jgi:hypothetical protein
MKAYQHKKAKHASKILNNKKEIKLNNKEDVEMKDEKLE